MRMYPFTGPDDRKVYIDRDSVVRLMSSAEHKECCELTLNNGTVQTVRGALEELFKLVQGA